MNNPVAIAVFFPALAAEWVALRYFLGRGSNFRSRQRYRLWSSVAAIVTLAVALKLSGGPWAMVLFFLPFVLLVWWVERKHAIRCPSCAAWLRQPEFPERPAYCYRCGAALPTTGE